MFSAISALRLPFDPVTLSYVMALRGIRPRLPQEEFAYGEIGCGTGERIIMFAACNPEGTFFGFDTDIEKLNVAATKAEQYGIANVTFSQASAAALKEAVDAGIIGEKCFDYLIYNEPDNSSKESIAGLCDISKILLKDNGVFAYRYRTYDETNADELLFKSLTRHLLAEQSDKGEAVAKDWRALCQLYFTEHTNEAAEFDKAIADGKGIEWLRTISGGDTKTSKTVQISQIFSGKDLTYVGSAELPHNYMELSTPDISHAPLESRRLHPLFEALKDLAINRNERIDLWGREPLERSDNLVTLFGGFTFGITEPPESINRTVNYQGKTINFAGPLYEGILSLASVMPVTIGDLVHHEMLKEIDAATLLNTVQLLVACGILYPMRASFEGGVELSTPKLVGPYNQSLRKIRIEMQDYAFVSTVSGRPVFCPAMTTLVLQSLDKGGLENMSGLMSDELMRLSDHPFLRPLNLTDAGRAGAEAYRQIEAIFLHSMVRWFSIGIIDNHKH
jgi:SAM-dependent methyltransferase